MKMFPWKSFTVTDQTVRTVKAFHHKQIAM